MRSRRESTRLVVGMIAGAMMIASGAIHSFLGWRALVKSFSAAGAPVALVQGLAVPWHFAGMSMITFGVIAIALLDAARRRATSLLPVRIIAVAYLLFALAGLALIATDPTFLLFFVPGALLLASTGLTDQASGDNRISSQLALLFPVVVSLALPLDARAQTPATIPTALASAALLMMRDFDDESPRFVVGRVPDRWSAGATVDPRARVVGGVEAGFMTMAVYGYPMDTTTALADLGRAIVGAGWRRAAVPPREGGFSMGRRSETPVFCGDSGFVSLSVVESSAKSSVISAQRFAGNGVFTPACGGGGRVTVLRPDISVEGQPPELTPPAGAKVLVVGKNVSGESMTLSASLVATMSPELVIRHYTTQLDSAGWRFGEVSVVSGAAMRRATKQEGAKEMAGLLTVLSAGEELRVLWQVLPARKP